MLKGRWLILFLILAMARVALAGGATIYSTITNNSSGAGLAGWKVDLIEGYAGTNNAGPNYVVGSPTFPSVVTVTTALFTGVAKLVNAARPTTDNFYDGRSDKSVTIRVWQGASAADVITTKGYYGINSYSLGPTEASPVDLTKNIQTAYKADAPDAPTVRDSGYNLTWNDSLHQYLVAFTLSAVPGTAWASEGVSYQIRVRKKAETTYAPERTHDGSPWNITETSLTSPYFVGSGVYVAQAHATNAFGDTWGPEREFTVPAGGGGGIASVTYNLKKADGGLGLNAIAAIHTVPFMVEATTGIDTVGKLVDAINAKSGSKNVVTFGWMEDGNATLQGWAISYDASGTATYTGTGSVTTGSDTLLVKDRIYQISVLNNVSVTFTSQ